ncbi:MAG TPA: hypothetical protein PKD26_16455 [Pyrinomonadaceae bacterium]|nr:hypothetical protein [Pyrinomonadaceae bacterium]
MLIIWAAILMTQGIFVAIVFVTRPGLLNFEFSMPLLGPGGRATGSTSAVIIAFAVAAVTAVLFSFAFKRRLNERAVEAQDPTQVQTGLIIALALCEAASLFGLALAFAFDYQYFFLLIALGAGAIVLHFPRREPLHAAVYRSQPPS